MTTGARKEIKSWNSSMQAQQYNQALGPATEKNQMMKEKTAEPSTAASAQPFSRSVIKVAMVVLLNPYLSSITKV